MPAHSRERRNPVLSFCGPRCPLSRRRPERGDAGGDSQGVRAPDMTTVHLAVLRAVHGHSHRHAPAVKAIASLQAAVKGREIMRHQGRELYIVYPDGIGRSKLTNTFIESRLDTRGTGRNWNTVMKLAALAGG